MLASLPDVDADIMIAACEVMWEEGLRAWSVPVGRLDLVQALRSPFGRRALIGVHGVTRVSEGTAAVAAGARFVAAPWIVDGLVEAAGELPVILGGLTPSELVAAAAAGAAAVQVLPVEALPFSYASALPSLVGDDIALIATGDLSREEASEWLDGGAVGVWTTGLASPEAVTDLDLDRLRVECQAWQL